MYLLKILLLIISTTSFFSQNIPLPKNYSIVDSVSGDLDKDGIVEKVIAYNTHAIDEESFESVPRTLIIYKIKNGSWTVWKTSKQALYGSNDGGMMGDPFGSLEIKKGVLIISHQGGSSWKWGHTDKYRFQNDDFYLIGYTSNSGKPCENWLNVDYNISTGKMIVNKTYDNCDGVTTNEHEVHRKKLKITLQHRQNKEIKITTPKYKHQIYIAIGTD